MNLPVIKQHFNAAPRTTQPPQPAIVKEPKKKSSRHLWWQKSIVRRSLSSVEPDLDHVISKSPFLRRQLAKFTKADNGIALFHRKEIQVGKLLGKGGFSFVYEITGFCLDARITFTLSQEERNLREYYAESVIDERNGEYRYCIKHLQDRLVQNPKDFQCAASDLAVEAAFLQAVDHPHILKIRALPANGLSAWDDGKHDGYFIVTDRLDTTLDKLIPEWKEQGSAEVASMDERYKYALELADALKYLHGNRIAFRDLKPHNIGFDMAGRIKLFDFGLCRELPSADESMDGLYLMSGVGTRRYMACEIINTGRYNLKADVYSWSMILWEMLSQQKPYAPYSTDDHRREVCKGGERPPLDSRWPIWIQCLLKMTWDENVQYRFTMKDAYDGLKAGMYLEMTEHSSSNHEVVHTGNLSPSSPTAVVDFSLGMEDYTPSVATECKDGISGPPHKRTVYLKLPDDAKRAYLEIEDSLVDSHHRSGQQGHR